MAIHFSPRQRQIVSLVAHGSSDKEIAAQLGLSPRTVRTHLEKLFHRHGFRSRAEAVSAWLGGDPHALVRPKSDECPYPRPFPDDFRKCPAFQPRRMLTL